MLNIFRSRSDIGNMGLLSPNAPFGPSTLEIADMEAITRMEDKVRILQQDLQTEKELKNMVERERSDLSCQLLTLTDRLEEAKEKCQIQEELNRKREFDLKNLRKLLSESSTQREDNFNVLTKKHHHVILDYQDQIEGLKKKNAKLNGKHENLQHEIIDLQSSMSGVRKDKLVAEKVCEEFETEAGDLWNKSEDLLKHIGQLDQQKTRFHNIKKDLSRELHDTWTQMDNLQYVKQQLMQKMEETQKCIENAENNRQQIQIQLQQVKSDLDITRAAVDEQCDSREKIEHDLAVVKMESMQWKRKYENEVVAHFEEVENVRKKIVQLESVNEDQIEKMVQKTSQLEKMKTRLESEVEVLVIQLEKTQNCTAILDRENEQLEKLSSELKARVDESNVEVDSTKRELEETLTELKKVTSFYEKTMEEKELLDKENKQWENDLTDVKSALITNTQKLHHLDSENKNLTCQFGHLQLDVKEEETALRLAKNKAEKALAELERLRVDMESRLHEKQSAMEIMREQMQFEMNRLSNAVTDYESRTNMEVKKMKKQYQAKVVYLEMTVENLNRSNVEAQKIIKKQNEQIKILQDNYQNTERELKTSLDEYALANGRLATLGTTLETCRSMLDNTTRARKQAESDLEEALTRITDSTAINANLTSVKNRLESELSSVRTELTGIIANLKETEEREKRALRDEEYNFEKLKEEREHSGKLEGIGRELEEHVKQLKVEWEEGEASAVLGTQRVLSKLETRIRDLETLLKEETRRHRETEMTIAKKERRVKEVQLQLQQEHKAYHMAQHTIGTVNEKINLLKRQLADTEALTVRHMKRARRYQLELEEVEARREMAESGLALIHAKHTSSVLAGRQESPMVYLLEEVHEA